MKYGIIVGTKFVEPIKQFGEIADTAQKFFLSNNPIWYEDKSGKIFTCERSRLVVDLHKSDRELICGKSLYRKA